MTFPVADNPTAAGHDLTEPGAPEEPVLSILFQSPGPADRIAVRSQPACFPDLHLDQIVAAITRGRQHYDLDPFFYEHLHDEEAIRYRQEVFVDLERPQVLSGITSFTKAMRSVRDALSWSAGLRDRYQRDWWLVDTAARYCTAVTTLTEHLGGLELHSRGLDSFRDHLTRYVGSRDFATLVADARQVREALGTVSYTIRITGRRCTVARYDGEVDYSAEVLDDFSRFALRPAEDHQITVREPPELNHVETSIVGLVAKLYPGPFAALDNFGERHRTYIDPTIGRFDREVQFYVAVLGYLAQLRSRGLSFCYPEVTRGSKAIFANGTFDLALAASRSMEGASIVPNDFSLDGPERVLVVTGPNQGGKTTFARTFGQLHHLAALGCPVAGRAARLYIHDQIYVHFARQEDLHSQRGKLEDELLRAKAMLAAVTPSSIAILNEPFASTTLYDAAFLGSHLMEELVNRDVLAVYVTFLDELASLAPSTVSMVSMVAPDNPSERTYKLVRKPADGLAFALSVAEKHRITYEALKQRVLR